LRGRIISPIDSAQIAAGLNLPDVGNGEKSTAIERGWIQVINGGQGDVAPRGVEGEAGLVAVRYRGNGLGRLTRDGARAGHERAQLKSRIEIPQRHVIVLSCRKQTSFVVDRDSEARISEIGSLAHDN
jgi:hypothetical protein